MTIEEVLLSPTTLCNLSCPHCDIRRSKKRLPENSVFSFLEDCKKHGIDRVGFTGGEPFLALPFLCSVAKKSVALGMYFDRIMTNGVWFRDKSHLENSLERLHKAGYDGSICLSVDYFHRQSIKKLKTFIKTVRSVWNREDMVSAAYTSGKDDRKTLKKLKAILTAFPKMHAHKIDLSPIGKAQRLKNPWDGKWFKEDYCKGPGNVFFILPDGSVKPCCGYANEHGELTIGNIGRDSVKTLLANLKKNRLADTIFNSGLSSIRKRLERKEYKFPGKTSNHCFFCHYIIENVPRKMLEACLQ